MLLPTENKIRDFLAENLQNLEADLVLINKEYFLPNRWGASGRVDILARDRYGQYVIIELKRSDQTARQALNELHKYVALLQANLGIPTQRIRCILVSTHWHELLVPFSEFKRTAHYSVEGYSIMVNPEGCILSSECVTPIEAPSQLKLCPEHIIYLFDQEDKCELALQPCVKHLVKLGVQDYVIIQMRYRGSSRMVIFPHCLYVAKEVFKGTKRYEIAESLDVDLEEYNAEESPFILEQELIGRLGEVIKYDHTFEIGYPEKFLAIREDWEVLKVYRGGRIEHGQTVICDDELLSMVAGLGGENSSFYFSFTSPKHPSHWKTAIEKAAYSLRGNKLWPIVLQWFCSRVERFGSDKDVSIRIFNPANILGSLYKVTTTGATTYLPAMEAYAASNNSSHMSILIGMVQCAMDAPKRDLRELVRYHFGNEFGLFLWMQQGSIWYKDEAIMGEIGLEYVAFWVESSGKEEPIIQKISINQSNEVVLSPMQNVSLCDLSKYFSEHREFITELSEIIETNSTGL
jgi:hypothetical protein